MRFFRSVLYGFLVTLAFSRFCAYSQSPTVTFTSIDLNRNPVTITFNVIGSVEEEYEIILYIMLENDKASKIKLEKVEGDVGEGKFAGVGRQIRWDRLELKNPREGAKYQFALEIRKASGGGIPWYLYPAAAAAGVVAYIAVKKPSSPPSTVASQIPIPPARP